MKKEKAKPSQNNKAPLNQQHDLENYGYVGFGILKASHKVITYRKYLILALYWESSEEEKKNNCHSVHLPLRIQKAYQK